MGYRGRAGRGESTEARRWAQIEEEVSAGLDFMQRREDAKWSTLVTPQERCNTPMQS